MMTRKHFIDLAETLASLKPTGSSISQRISYMTWHEIVKEIANMCARHNDRFDEEKFLIACEGECDGCK